MEWIKDRIVVLTVGWIAYSVALLIIVIAAIANLGSVLYRQLLSYLPPQ